MRRALEIMGFLGLSAVVHAGVVTGLGDASGGPQGQGAGGADRVTLQAAPESLSALAARWSTAPATAPTPAALPAPALPDALPDALPQSPAALAPAAADRDRPVAPRSAPRMVTPTRPADPNVTADVPPPAASTALAAATSPRPAQRPAPPAAAVPAAPPQPPQAARVAAGAGGGAAAGTAATVTPPAATPGPAERQSLMAQWGARIMARVERARPNVRASGQVLLALQVTPGGQITGLSVARSSGDPALDEAALSALRRIGRFPAAPEGLTDAAYAFSLPIRFR